MIQRTMTFFNTERLPVRKKVPSQEKKKKKFFLHMTTESRKKLLGVVELLPNMIVHSGMHFEFFKNIRPGSTYYFPLTFC